MAEALLKVNQLVVSFATPQGVISPVRNVSFSLNAHETLGIIGESGCGKSVTAQAIMGLLSRRTSRIDGEITLAGQALDSLSAKERRRLSGREMAMVFQDPLASLNPVMTIGQQIDESLRLHSALSRSERQAKGLKLLEQVGIPDPPRCLAAWPHELSGGMRQRVMIAIAISTSPKVLIADEPTTALDATIQAQILDLLDEIKQQTGMAIMIITHDLSVVARLCQRVVVLYAGQIVEESDVYTLFETPRHPYTRALLAARPSLHQQPKGPLPEIKGQVPALYNLPGGCAYADRCPLVEPRCRVQQPELRLIGGIHHHVRCWRSDVSGEINL